MSPLQMEPRNKNLLIVTCGFPPSGGMGIYRITKFVKYLSRHDWNIYVVTVHPTKYGRKDYSLLKDIPEEINIFKTNELYTSRRNNKFARMRFFFDYYIKWYPRAIIKGKKIIKENDIDLIFVSYPWASHLVIGFILSIITNRSLIIDYRDYWTKGFFPFSLFFDYLEKIIIQKSEYVIFNNYHTSELYKFKYKGILGDKYDIIENGYDNEDRPCVVYTENNYYNIVYTGNPYNKNIQRPFLRAIKQLVEERQINKKNFKITFVGYLNNLDRDYIINNEIEPYFEFVEDVTHNESITFQMKASLLLLFADFDSFKDMWCTPGKFFEYLGTGKPILLLADKKSAMADYLEWTKSGLLVEPHDVQMMKTTIYKLYNDWKNLKILTVENNPILPRENFNIKNLTKKLENIFLTYC